jgi:hypothetical protein
MRLKPTAECQISTLIFGFGGAPYAYLMKKYRRMAKFFATWGLDQRYCVHPNPNIKVDIWHPAVVLRCIIPPRHLSQLKAREYLWSNPKWQRTLAFFGNFSWDMHSVPPQIQQQGVKYQLWYLDLGGRYAYPMKHYRRTAKFFATRGLSQRYCPGL